MKRIFSCFLALTLLLGILPWSAISTEAAVAADFTISQVGIDFIKAREGFSSTCYPDTSQSSIGYGTKCGTDVHEAGLHSITREAAEAAMRAGIERTYVPSVRSQMSGVQMNQHQFDALVSLAYNTGGGTTIIKNSPLGKYLRGELSQAEARSAYASYYVMSDGQVLAGLVSRRNAEAELFFSGENDPLGMLDFAMGGLGSVTLGGWIYDKNDTSAQLEFHVYIGGPAGSDAQGYSGLHANTYRPDVNSDAGHLGVGEYHGFDVILPTNLTGTQTVYVYAINVGSGENALVGTKSVTIQADTTAPVVSDIRFTDVTDEGYTVTCRVTDDSGFVSSVQFPTWSNPEQDDVLWGEGTSGTNGTYTYRVHISDHNGERGEYSTDVYAYDPSGNSVVGGRIVVQIPEPTPLAITAQPKTTYTRPGEIARVTVAAQGDGLAYQWYIKNPGQRKFSKSSVTSASYSTTMRDAANGRQVYCVITDKYGNTVTSDTATLKLPTPLQITTQPKTTYTKLGATAKVTLAAQGDDLTYQWYIKNAGKTKYSKSSVTSATYSCKMSASSKDRLAYCVITDAHGNSLRTETVRLRMAASITTEPANVYVKSGATAKATVKASGDGLKYQWYIKNAGGTKYSKSSVTSATYACKMSTSSKDRLVYCVVTDRYGNTARSKTIVLRMTASITTQPKSVSVAKGAGAKVTFAAAGDGLKYEWYYKDTGMSAFKKTASFTGNSYSVVMSAARSGRQIYCKVTDKYGNTVKTDTVTLKMK